jgi:phosphate transport system substrate-binding protein
MAKYPNTKVRVQGGGSSQGIEAAVSGVAQIGSISRDIKEEEKAKGLKATNIAVDGVSIVVNPANKVNALKIEDVKNIYLGNIKNWKELGGDDEPITIVSREEGSGTRDLFSEKIMNKENILSSAVIQTPPAPLEPTVAGDKNAIGYISMSTVNKEVKAVSLDGVEPAEANVKAGTYKLQRPFIYVTKGIRPVWPNSLSTSY